MRFLPKTILALAFLAPAVSQAAEPSIMGLTFGISDAQVRAKLGSSYSIQTIQTNNPKAATLYAINNDRLDDYSLGFENDKLWYVKHRVKFSSSTEPNTQNLIGDLTTKFGLPTSKNSVEGNQPPALSWVYGPDEKLMVPPPQGNPNDPKQFALSQKLYGYMVTCRNNLANFSTGTPGSYDGWMHPQSQFESNCSKTIAVSFQVDDQNTALMQTMSLAMSNSKMMYDFLADDAAAKAQSQQNAAEKAKANHPSL